MIGIESMKYSLNNLRKRKARSFLTILSIFIGIATIFIFISFGLGLYNYTNSLLEGSSADKLIIQAKGSGAPGLDTAFKLLEDDLDAVEKSSGVMEASGVYSKVAEVKKKKENKFVFLMGYDPKKSLIMEVFSVDIEIGRELRSGDDNKVVLGYNYLKDNKIFSRGFNLGEKIEIQGKEFQIVGFYSAVGNPQDDSNIYLTDKATEDLYGRSISYAMIIARVDPDRIEETTENIERSLRNERNLDEGKEDFFVQSFQDLIESYSSALNIIVGFIVLIALISVFVSAINTANTMITSVIERIKEIGIIKAIGARNSEIFGIFLFESSLLGGIAGIIGVLVGFVISYLIGSILDSLGWGFLSPAYPTNLFIGLVLFAVITGAISGVIPAWRASKTNVVDALRYE